MKFCGNFNVNNHVIMILNHRITHIDFISFMGKSPGPWFNIKMSSYQHRKSHCGDKTVVRSSYLHNGISYTGKVSSSYWIGAQNWLVTFQQCRNTYSKLCSNSKVAHIRCCSKVDKNQAGSSRFYSSGKPIPGYVFFSSVVHIRCGSNMQTK